MFGIGFTEILMFAVIALVVIGPEKLPHAARIAGAWYGRITRTLGNIQREIEQEVGAAEFKKQFDQGVNSLQKFEQQVEQQINQPASDFLMKKETHAHDVNEIDVNAPEIAQTTTEETLIPDDQAPAITAKPSVNLEKAGKYADFDVSKGSTVRIRPDQPHLRYYFLLIGDEQERAHQWAISAYILAQPQTLPNLGFSS